MAVSSRKIRRIDDVVAWRFCMGCGACASVCSNEAVFLIDLLDVGIRPQVNENKCQSCGDCIQICPGIMLAHKPFPENTIAELKAAWGPVLELWEGYASDQMIRYAGSSGGTVTALALYGLENGIADGILHVGVDSSNPIKNIPVYSTVKDQLLASTGSRYSPAAVCQAFGTIKQCRGKSIFIGKPCDVAALRKACVLDRELNSKIAFTVSIFCAGTPTSQGTMVILEKMGINPVTDLKSFRYRGNGWPGQTKAVKKNGDVCTMEYVQSWGEILSTHGQLRCRLCPESTGEFADISCGDPWYRDTEADDTGRSLVLVRTRRGQEVLQNAMRVGLLKLERVKPEVLPLSQKSLLRRRRHLWARLLSMRLLGMPIPNYVGFHLWENWTVLSSKEKIRSFLGTFKRIIMRKLYSPLNLTQD